MKKNCKITKISWLKFIKFRSLKENTEDQNLQVIDPRDDEEEIISTKVNKTMNATVKSEENCIVEDEVGDNQSDFDENPPVETLSRLKKVVIKVNDEYEEKFVSLQ